MKAYEVTPPRSQVTEYRTAYSITYVLDYHGEHITDEDVRRAAEASEEDLNNAFWYGKHDLPGDGGVSLQEVVKIESGASWLDALRAFVATLKEQILWILALAVVR